MTQIIITLPDGKKTRINKADSRIVYNIIARYLCSDITRISEEDHLIATNAESWTELATIGETYETSKLPGLKIEIIQV